MKFGQAIELSKTLSVTRANWKPTEWVYLHEGCFTKQKNATERELSWQPSQDDMLAEDWKIVRHSYQEVQDEYGNQFIIPEVFLADWDKFKSRQVPPIWARRVDS